MKKILFLLFAVMSAVTMFAEEQTADSTQSQDVWRSGKYFYQGDQLLTKTEYSNLLKNTCPEAFRQYEKGRKHIIAGWSVFGVGATVFVVGSSLLCVADYYDRLHAEHFDPERPTMSLGVGYTFTALDICYPIAGAFMLSSVPVLCVGYHNRNKSIETYNLQCGSKEPAITYNLTAGQNGLGFAINF